jgi:hypothetical protein
LNSPSHAIAIGDKSITVYTGEPSPDVALPYLEAITAKTYTCQCCNKRVDAKGKFGETYQSVLTASKLCFDCHFWLQKLGDNRTFFIAGHGYSLDKECSAYIADLPRYMFTPRTYVVRQKVDGVYVYSWSLTKVWCAGRIDGRVRQYVSDNAEWVCPLCLDPIHQDDGMYGYCCKDCDPQNPVNVKFANLVREFGGVPTTEHLNV